MGELMCFVMAWAVGAAILWSDHIGRNREATADRVAVSGAAPASNVDFD